VRATDRFCGEEGLNCLCDLFAQETTHAGTHTHTHIHICLYLGSTLDFVKKKPHLGELSAKILQKKLILKIKFSET